MARPGRQERNRTARSLRQLTRFHHGSNSDEVFGTHRIRDKPTAPASPWQNGFVERLIGSIRRECVDHIIVLGEVHLRQILKSYARYLYEGLACQEVFSRLTFLLFLRFKRARASAILH